VTPALLQRQAALAAVALLATLGALALTNRAARNPSLPPVNSSVQWESAVVGVLSPKAYSKKTTCGVELDSGTIGVRHPVLPCGVDLVLSLGNKQVRTEVVARGRVEAGHEFDVTKALADALGFHGTRTIHWRFAG